ncbi:MAG: holo-ACP synthase [Hydrogenophilales bacterium]|nr:holo-ACP synthase [Hydrogenophilales bacterium]
MIVRALQFAGRDLFTGRMLSLVLWPMGLALLFWGVLAWGFGGTWKAMLVDLLAATPIRDLAIWAGAEWLLPYSAIFFLILLWLPAVYVTALLVTSLALMPSIVTFVAGRDYPALECRRGGTVVGSVTNGVWALLLYILAWVVTLPLAVRASGFPGVAGAEYLAQPAPVSIRRAVGACRCRRVACFAQGRRLAGLCPVRAAQSAASGAGGESPGAGVHGPRLRPLRPGSCAGGAWERRMIHGIGTDLVAVARIAQLHSRFGERLARRLLAADELTVYADARDPARFLAKRFAAKEALAKALGTGLRAPVSLGNIAVRHDELGRPAFAVTAPLTAWLEERGIVHLHLSLSDEHDHVLAFAIAERETCLT